MTLQKKQMHLWEALTIEKQMILAKKQAYQALQN